MVQWIERLAMKHIVKAILILYIVLFLFLSLLLGIITWLFILVISNKNSILVVNQAKPQQFPVAVIIAGAGYVVNFFSSKRFGASQVSNAIG